MPQQPTKCRHSAVGTEGTVGRCCQRHGITGQVITDWYPVGIIEYPVNNRCCQVVGHSSIHGTARRRTRRRTVLGASDKYPEQSSILCAGSRHPRRRVLGPSQSMNLVRFGGRWNGDQNPTNWYILSIKNVCDLELQSLDLTTPERSPSSHREVGQ